MKNIVTLLLFFLCFEASAQFALGDIGFLCYNSDGTDNVQFILFNDIPPNSELNFTDSGWQANGQFRANEGFITWNTGASTLNAGTIVTIDFSNQTASNGTLTSIQGGFPNLSASGDQVLAYTGSIATPSFVSGIQMNGNWDADATSSNTSSEPLVFNGTDFAVAISPEVDNAVYDGPTEGTPQEIRAFISDPSNWTTSNDLVNYTYMGSIILPVSWTYFKIYHEDKGVLLKWETATEINNDYFVVERSSNGSEFKAIEMVVGQGTKNTSTLYEVVDKSPESGMNYYRIKQVDFDGAYEYSKVVSINKGNNGNVFTSIYPTLTSDVVTAEVSGLQNAQYLITDMNGQAIKKGNLNHSKNTIDVMALPTGVYIIHLFNDTFSSAHRFVKP